MICIDLLCERRRTEDASSRNSVFLDNSLSCNCNKRGRPSILTGLCLSSYSLLIWEQPVLLSDLASIVACLLSLCLHFGASQPSKDHCFLIVVLEGSHHTCKLSLFSHHSRRDRKNTHDGVSVRLPFRTLQRDELLSISWHWRGCGPPPQLEAQVVCSTPSGCEPLPLSWNGRCWRERTFPHHVQGSTTSTRPRHSTK